MMKFFWRTGLWLIMGLLLVNFSTGCLRDPNARKQRYIQAGTRYFDAQRYREAAIEYQNAIKIDSQDAEAHYRLALCFEKLNLSIQAYRELVRVVDLQPDNLKAQLELGNLFAIAQQFNDAQKKAELVIQKEPNNVDAHVLLATVYAGLKEVDASLREMRLAIQLDPNRSDSYVNLALLQLRANQVGPAEESLKKAIQLAPTSLLGTMLLGNLYLQQRRWEEAEQQYQRAMQMEPKNPDPRAALARLFLAEGRKEEAEKILVEAKRDLADNSVGYRLLGDFYISLGELDKALAEYASLYSEHAKDLQVKKNYVRLLLMRGRFDEATRLNDEILKANAGDADARIIRAQILTAQGRADDAIPVLQSVLKSEPDNAAAHYYLGVAFNFSGKMDQAESEWRQALRLQPGMIEVNRALATVAERKGDVSLLNQTAEALINAQPASPEGYLLRAMAKLARRDPQGGEADLNQAIALAPQNPVGYSSLATWRASQQRFAEAEKLYEKALELNPKYADALRGLLAVYSRQRQSGKALARLKAQIARVPDQSAYHLMLGLWFMQSKEWDQAEVALQKAIELDKNNTDAYVALEQVEISQGSVEKAIETYQHLIQTNPNDIRSYMLLAGLEQARGDWQKAEEIYQKVLRIQPDYPLAGNNLAYLMLEHGGDVDVALSLAQVARQKTPDSPEIADTLGWAYYRKGIYGLAADLLQEAAKKMPQDATAHYHLGLALQKTGDNAGARAHLERALSLDPRSSRAGEIRRALAGIRPLG